MIESKELLSQLVSLAQLDVDAVHAYGAAIDRIDIPEVKHQLTRFRAEHDRHITDLTPLILRLGGQTPTRKPDLKGYLLEGFTAIRSAMSNEQALKAMKGNEELTNKTYAKVLAMELPTDVSAVVRRNREDERRHLEYVVRCIDTKIWDKKHAA